MQKKNSVAYLFSGIAFMLFCICIYRAMHMSMTHDESGTYLFWYDQSVLPFFYDTSVWTSANNHLLNTFLFQLSERLFGFSDFSIRLPNVLSWILYSSSCILLSRMAFKAIGAQIIFLSFTLLNPYVFDFFSLCRGYGLSLALLSASLLAAGHYLSHYSLARLALCYTLLLLSSAAILSHAILIPCFAITAVVLAIYRRGLSASVPTIMSTIGFLALSSLMLYTPIKALSQNGELAYGNQNLYSSWSTLTQDTLMGKAYLGESTFSIFAIAILISIAITIITLLIRFRRSSEDHSSGTQLFFMIVFSLLIISLLLAHTLLGSEYPINRKSLFIIPIAAGLLASGAELIRDNALARGIGIVVLLTCSLHMINTLQLDHTREWWYDSHTKTFVTDIRSDSKNQPASIGTDWLFHPTLSYYIITNEWSELQLQPYQKELDTETVYDYFISTAGAIPRLEKSYDMINRSATDAVLWKKK